QCRGISASERGVHRERGQFAGLLRIVEVGSNRIAAALGCSSAATRARATGPGAQGSLTILFLDDRVHVFGFHHDVLPFYLQTVMMLCGVTALFRVQHSAYRKPSSSRSASVSAE